MTMAKTTKKRLVQEARPIDLVYIGMKVEMVTRKLFAYGDNGVIVYGYKFRPPVLRPMNGHANHDALHSTEPERTTVAVTAGD